MPNGKKRQNERSHKMPIRLAWKKLTGGVRFVLFRRRLALQLM